MAGLEKYMYMYVYNEIICGPVCKKGHYDEKKFVSRINSNVIALPSVSMAGGHGVRSKTVKLRGPCAVPGYVRTYLCGSEGSLVFQTHSSPLLSRGMASTCVAMAMRGE